MSDKLDMSLDDIIKMEGISGNKKRGGGAGRGGGLSGGRGGRSGLRGRGAAGGPLRTSGGSRLRGGGQRTTPYTRAAKIPDKWQHDMFEGGPRTRAATRSGVGGVGGASHLLVSNLEYGVSDTDIQELFIEFGPLKKAAVHYDRAGRSLGTADVIFEKRSDATRAMNQYNGVPLDGRPMKIQLVTSEGAAGRASGAVASSFGSKPKFGASSGATSRTAGGGGGRGRGRGGAGSRGRGGAGGASRGKTPTAEELDAELDAYVNKM